MGLLRLANAVIEPYNMVMYCRTLLEHTDVAIVLHNEALYDLCRRSLDIKRPTYSNLNSLIAQVISFTTMQL